MHNRGNNLGTRLQRRLLKQRKTAIIQQIIPYSGNVPVTFTPRDLSSPTAVQTTGTVTNALSPTNLILVATSAPPVTPPPPTATTISESSIMMMRARTIAFRVSGLKPLAQYYPFFDGIYVGGFCSTTNAAVASNIVANALGTVVGNFYLPGGTFATGSHTFLLVDNTDNNSNPTTPNPLYGGAAASYEANGTLKIMQAAVIAPPPPPPPAAPMNPPTGTVWGG